MMLGRSLEFNWLKKFDRSLVTPAIVFANKPHVEGQECGGYYVRPGKHEWFLDEKYYDCRFGLIVVSTDWESPAATIAHEWRHHWQLHNGIEFDDKPFDASLKWCAAVRKYFRESRSEMDALLFEARAVRLGEHEQMMDAVFGIVPPNRIATRPAT